jgi:hypothetical protein
MKMAVQGRLAYQENPCFAGTIKKALFARNIHPKDNLQAHGCEIQ